MLIELLRDAFNSDELRRFLSFLPDPGPTIARSLGKDLSHDSVAFEVVRSLERHNFLNDTFFEALKRERPHRSAQITQLREKLQNPPSSSVASVPTWKAPVAPPPSPHASASASSSPSKTIAVTPSPRNSSIDLLSVVRKALHELQASLQVEHFPSHLDRGKISALIESLNNLELSDVLDDDFRLSIGERMLSLGKNLIDGFINLRKNNATVEDENIAQVIQCFILHELYHAEQGIESTIHSGVGASVVALEEVDYHADAISIATLSSWKRDRKGVRRTKLREVCESFIRATILGIEVFDRFSGQIRIETLLARRLRRYLTWHLQLARIKTLHELDPWEMLRKRLFVELAPLEGTLDTRHRKIVTSPLENTELFIVIEGRLLRQGRESIFNPMDLVSHIRGFYWEEIQVAMEFIREKHRVYLTPWRSI